MHHLFVWGNVGGGPACRSDIDDIRAAHLLLPLGVTVAPGHWGHASTFTSVDKTAANLFLFLLRMRCIITGDEVPCTVRSRFLLHLFGGLQRSLVYSPVCVRVPVALICADGGDTAVECHSGTAASQEWSHPQKPQFVRSVLDVLPQLFADNQNLISPNLWWRGSSSTSWFIKSILTVIQQRMQINID